MKLPEFSASSLSKIDHQPPIYGLGAVVKNQLSGTLQIKIDKSIRLFQFEKGNCISVSSNVKSELPGSFLFKEGRINETQHKSYLQENLKVKKNAWELAQKLANLSEQELENKKKRLAEIILTTASAGLEAELTFQPTSSGSNLPILFPYQRVLILATSALSSEQIDHLCPQLTMKSLILIDPKKDKEIDGLALGPEERGVLTVIRNSKTVAEVFSGSFLNPQKIHPLLFSYWLGELFLLETEEDAEMRKLLASLSPKERALREEILNLERSPASYYEWLSITPSISISDITKKASSLIERYASPSVEKLFLKSEKNVLSTVIGRLEEARGVLSNVNKKTEYDQFLASGQSGSFLVQSSAIKTETIFNEAQKLLSEGKVQQAISLFEKALGEDHPSNLLIATYAKTVLKVGGAQNPSLQNRVLEELKKAFRKSPEDLHIISALGEWLEALHQKEKALQAYKRALQIDLTSSMAREGLKRVDREEGSKAMIQTLYPNLHKLNYYQLLCIDPQSNLNKIHSTYRDYSKHLHPDRFFQSEDQDLKEQAKETFKRIVEAYMTLKDPMKRKEYDQKIAQAIHSGIHSAIHSDRSDSSLGQSPHQAVTRESHPETHKDEPPKTRQGKKFFDLAINAIREGKLDTAKLNLQLGLQIEPNNTVLKEKLEEVLKLTKRT